MLNTSPQDKNGREESHFGDGAPTLNQKYIMYSQPLCVVQYNKCKIMALQLKTQNFTNLLLFFSFFFTSPISSLQFSINVWPKPRAFNWPHPQATLLSPNFTIISPHRHYLSSAVDRHLRRILTENHSPLLDPSLNISSSAVPLQKLVVKVADLSAPLQNGVNESYTLDISVTGSASLVAATAWGAMRGLETFSQLVWGDPLRVPVGFSLWDAPLFQHRGLMLDTSRNYYGVEDILRTIAAMSMNKLNVFHWHITDSHSFPLVVPSEPELAAKGAYGDDMQYSPEDVRRIIKFGMEHGVRVLPEIDSPGEFNSVVFFLS